MFVIALICFTAAITNGFLRFLSYFIKNSQKKQYCYKGRLSAFCLFFTCFIIIFSIGIIKYDFIDFIKNLSKINYIYYGIIVFIVFCSSISYKKIFPVTLLLYAIYVSFALFFLIANYGMPNKTNLIYFTNDKALCNQKQIPITFQNKENQQLFVVLENISFSEEFLLPISKKWYKVVAIVDKENIQNFPKEKTLENNSILTYIKKNLSRFAHQISIELPQFDFYPVQYSLKVDINSPVDYIYQLDKIL